MLHSFRSAAAAVVVGDSTLFYGEGALVARVSVDPQTGVQPVAELKLLVVDEGEHLAEEITDCDTVGGNGRKS